MAGVTRLPDTSEQLTARCAELVDGAGCETAEAHPYRSPAEAPLRKLTVDLIKTYRKINEVSETQSPPVEVSSCSILSSIEHCGMSQFGRVCFSDGIYRV